MANRELSIQKGNANLTYSYLIYKIRGGVTCKCQCGYMPTWEPSTQKGNASQTYFDSHSNF